MVGHTGQLAVRNAAPFDGSAKVYSSCRRDGLLESSGFL